MTADHLDDEHLPLMATFGDTMGLDIHQLVALIRTHYISPNGQHVDVIRGGAGKDWPSNVWRIRDRKQVST